jgi:putative hydrolase of the HAD superfamily
MALSPDAIDAVCLDLDDTLFAYAPADEAGLDAAHAVFQARFGDLDRAAFGALHDETRRAWAERLAGTAASHNRLLFFKHMAERCGVMAPEHVLEAHEAYWGGFCERMEAAPETTALLEKLAARWPLTIISNQVTAVQLRKLAALDCERFFAHVLTSEETGADKPDPALFREALARLGTAAARTLMVGDQAEGDVRGAHACGLRTAHCTEHRRDKTPAPEADLVLERLVELGPALGL